MNNTLALHFAKAFYFLYYGAWAFLLPFLALYYQDLGFTGSQIGLLSSISPLVTLFAAPFWGGLADALQRHKRVLMISLAGAWLSVLGLSQAREFWLIAPAVAGYAFFSATVMPLVDNSVLTLLGDHRERYGSQRVWGAIGWGLAGPLAGWLTGFSLGWAFTGYLALVAATILVTVRLPVSGAPQRSPFWAGVRKLLSDRRWFVFLLVCFVSGAGLSVVTNFLFLYMNELKASSTVMGLALAMATISEIPVLFFSGRMLHRWGPRGLLVISLAAYVARAYGYSIASEPWQVLLIQLLHGLTFSTMWVAGVSFAAEMAPKGLGATAQGLFSSTVMGVGGITGSLVGGLLLDRFGGAGMYFWSGSAVLVGLLLFLLAGRRLSRPTPAVE